MMQLYGNSYDSIGQQELSRDAARDSRFFRSMDAQRALEAMAQQQQQQEAANRFQQMQFLAQQRQQQYANRFSAENQQYSHLQNYLQQQFQNKQFYDRLASQEKVAGLRLGEVSAKDANRTGERDYNEAFNMISQGVPPDQASALFKSIAPDERARLQAHYANLAQLEEQNLAPSIATQQEQLVMLRQALEKNKRTKAEADELKKFTPFKLDSTIKKEVADLPSDKLPKLDQETFRRFIQDNILKDHLDSLLRADPTTQSIEPVPLPRKFRLNAPTAIGLTNAPAMAAAPTNTPPAYPTEIAARQAGHRSGDVVYLWDQGSNRLRPARLR